MSQETYTLTPWGCLSAVLEDYGVDVSGIRSKVGEHIVEDFMEAIVISGYVERKDDEGDMK